MNAKDRRTKTVELGKKRVEAKAAFDLALNAAITQTKPNSPARHAVVEMLSRALDLNLTAKRAINLLAGRKEFA